MSMEQKPSAIFKNEPSWLQQARDRAFGQFKAASLPADTDERWRRSEARDFDPETLLQQPLLVNGQAVELLAKPVETNYQHLIDKAHIFVVGGGQVKSAGLPIEVSPGLRVAVGEKAASLFPELVQRYLGESSADFGGEVFANFHRAMFQNLVIIDLADDVRIDKPVLLLFRNENAALLSTVIVNLGVRASLQFAEDYRAAASGGQLLTRFRLGNQAHLASVMYFGGEAVGNFLHQCDAELGEYAELRSAMVWRGGRKVRSLVQTRLLGVEARSELRGIVAGSARQHFDIEPCQIHVAPHTNSDMLFKTVLTEKSRAIFQGDITMERTAQHSEAYQLNKNLLLSPQARVDTLPRLSILPDDVKCKHGAATGSMDPQQLYYLMARGFTQSQAVNLILKGFLAEVIGKLPEGHLQQTYDEILAADADQFAATANMVGQ